MWIFSPRGVLNLRGNAQKSHSQSKIPAVGIHHGFASIAVEKSPRIKAQNARVPPQPGQAMPKKRRDAQPGENRETNCAISSPKKNAAPAKIIKIAGAANMSARLKAL